MLFNLPNTESDPEWIAKEFFNSAYLQGVFISVVNGLAKSRSQVINEDYCLFPDLGSPDVDLHFDGIKFGLMGDAVVIGQNAFNELLRAACDCYIRLHPEDRNKLPM